MNRLPATGDANVAPGVLAAQSLHALSPRRAENRILIIDDEPNARAALRSILTEEGFIVAEAHDGKAGLAALATFDPHIVLCDLRMPGIDGLSLLKQAIAERTASTFVMMTAFASIETAVEAMRAGAETYLVKPLDVNAVLVVLEKALEKRSLRNETEVLRARVQKNYRFANIVGDSPEIQAVFEIIKRAAPTKATVLILGESGTGKELVAQAIHEESPRRGKHFVKVNCAALSESLLESELFGHEKGSFTGAVGRREGRFELADGGTLFLDEVGEITPAMQVKLLRVLQQHELERVGGTQTIKVDVRIVAATNRNLEAEVKAGRFREDLFYRLNVVAVTLPPLRNRKADVPALIAHFIEKYAAEHGKQITGMAPGMMATLLAHDWPGNVRELGNIIERAVVLADGQHLTTDDLPPALRGPRPVSTASTGFAPGASLFDIEREAILRTLEMVGGSTARAAEMLKISVRKIQYRLKEYGGEVPPVDRDEAES